MTSFRISEEEFEQVSEWAVQLRLGVAKRYSHDDDDLGLIAIDVLAGCYVIEVQDGTKIVFDDFGEPEEVPAPKYVVHEAIRGNGSGEFIPYHEKFKVDTAETVLEALAWVACRSHDEDLYLPFGARDPDYFRTHDVLYEMGFYTDDESDAESQGEGFYDDEGWNNTGLRDNE